ncbi:MAG TPA: metal-dependent hydrolase [Bdellovibrionales bacterium]|nr:metal-dependent hydrolase [Bdellovibrionales bacterium]
MASIFSHPAIPVSLALMTRLPKTLVLIGVIAAILPDADVVLLRFGVEHGSQWGHRGFSHSFAVAALTGALAAAFARRLGVRPFTAFWFVSLSMASHGLLDAMTTGGRGIAFFWPLNEDRYFLPWRVIEVSPLSVQRFFSGRGLEILQSEWNYVWFPAFLTAFVVQVVKRLRR